MKLSDDGELLLPIQLLHFGRLYLSRPEVKQLAEQLEHELVCRTADQRPDPVVVADMILTPLEAWQLVDRLESAAIEEFSVAKADWLTEGF